jgi:hypothetical protein
MRILCFLRILSSKKSSYDLMLYFAKADRGEALAFEGESEALVFIRSPFGLRKKKLDCY